MPHPLFKSPDERMIAVTAGAAVVLHALICANENGPLGRSTRSLVPEAFEVAEAFIAEAERRFGP